MAQATGCGLPMVSVRSGRRADGYAPAGRPLGSIRLPLTQPEFNRLMLMRGRQKSGRLGSVGFLVAGIALSRIPVLLYMGILISLVSAVLWMVATIGITMLLPAVEIDRARGTVALGRVHRGFAEAVTDADA